jgi:hypothetical protein
VRVAIIYTGHLRTWEKCRKNHEVNLWTDDADLFFHTYDEPFIDLGAPGDWTPIPGEYHYIIDHPYNARRRPEISIGNTLNQWHNNFIGFCIAPKGYDVYVRCRPDIIFSGHIDLNQDLSGNKIYIPSGQDYYSGFNDQFAFGNYETMKAYYSVYLNHGKMFEDGLIFHTEEYVTENMKRCGLNIIRLPITNQILRA